DGHYSSIVNEVELIHTDIDLSVILEVAKVINIPQRIVDSLIGQRAFLTTTKKRPKALRLLIGDDSTIELMS
ncbi:MAG: glucose-1-phosphate thymidylyltransferase, partial [Kamptonema sp. SIO4C4]|nr:glucose-1-phosphate thymidylyltransferase [Kamptonema sp. SIO4C4]